MISMISVIISIRISKIIRFFDGAARSFFLADFFLAGFFFWRTSRTENQKIIKRWSIDGQEMVKRWSKDGQKMVKQVKSRSKDGEKVVKS